MPCDRRLSLEEDRKEITVQDSVVSMPCDRRLSLEGQTGIRLCSLFTLYVSMPCDRRLSLEGLYGGKRPDGTDGDVSMPCDRRLSLEVDPGRKLIHVEITFQCRVTGVYPSKAMYTSKIAVGNGRFNAV